MKKGLPLLLSFVLLFSCSERKASLSYPALEEKLPLYTLSEEEEGSFLLLSASDLSSFLSRKESFLLLVSVPDCPNVCSFLPEELDRILKEEKAFLFWIPEEDYEKAGGLSAGSTRLIYYEKGRKEGETLLPLDAEEEALKSLIENVSAKAALPLLNPVLPLPKEEDYLLFSFSLYPENGFQVEEGRNVRFVLPGECLYDALAKAQEENVDGLYLVRTEEEEAIRKAFLS